MKVSRERVSENRQKILKAAGRLFRERGFEAVTVAEIMRAAGLTHGGFYGYFRSKDDLIVGAIQDALSEAPGPSEGLAAYAAEYLAPEHRDDLAGGCPTAGLASESLRQSPEARAALGAALRRQIERLSRAAPGTDPAARRRAAIGSWSAMVGALVLSRVSDDRQLSDEVLTATRDWIAGTGAPV